MINLKYLFVGFFDGDGTCRDKKFGSINCHKSWFDVFKFFEEKEIVKNVRMTLNDQIKCTISVEKMKELSRLPVPKMVRKWSKIKE